MAIPHALYVQSHDHLDVLVQHHQSMLHVNFPHVFRTHLNKRQLLRNLVPEVDPKLLLLHQTSRTSFTLQKLLPLLVLN